MINALIKWLIFAGSLILTSKIVPGISISGLAPAMFGVFILGLVNIFIKPLIIILTLPINIFTLGLFTFFINGFMFMIASFLSPGFEVENFWAGFGGAFVFSILSILVNHFIE